MARSLVCLLLGFCCLTLAELHPASNSKRATSGSILDQALKGLGADAKNGAKVASAVLNDLEALAPTSTPTSIPDAINDLSSIHASPTDIFDSAAAAIEKGFDPRTIENIIAGFSAEENSYTNVNPRNPPTPIYPKKSGRDAPYSLSAKALRGGVFIPSTFTYGAKPPVILVPGTGVPGGKTFGFELGVQLANETFADPLWLNVPKSSLDDAQITSEYVSYAINYIAGITGRNVSVVAFSQGSLNVQWSLKYWPSTRTVVDDFIALSGDYHGTVNARLLCPSFPALGCTPSILQQVDTSNYVKTLLSNGGDSAYVPTTNVDSLTDEIVQPRAGKQNSGILKDVRHVGVTNTQVQSICKGTPAGTLVTHEGILYNAIAYALVVDALTNAGPGRASRLDLTKTCSMFVSPGLSLLDVVATESTILVLAENFLTYTPKVNVEPPIKSYAR